MNGRRLGLYRLALLFKRESVCTGAELGTVICDTYYANVQRIRQKIWRLYPSLISPKFPALCDAFNLMANEMTGVYG
jgi:hypothetical protein